MESVAANLLNEILDKCRGASVSEVRFVSGMSPSFVTADGPHSVQVRDLSRDLVGQLHELCLSLNDGDVSASGNTHTYTFALRGLGRFLCTFTDRGNAASLVLVLDSDAAETIDAVGPRKRPTLGAEAERDRNGH